MHPIFPRNQSEHNSVEVQKKSGLRVVKRENFIRDWRRSGLKNPDKPNIFIEKNVRNHSYHKFYPVLAKIWINRVFLYILNAVIKKLDNFDAW